LVLIVIFIDTEEYTKKRTSCSSFMCYIKCCCTVRLHQKMERIANVQ